MERISRDRDEAKMLYAQGWSVKKGGWVADFGPAHSRSVRGTDVLDDGIDEEKLKIEREKLQQIEKEKVYQIEKENESERQNERERIMEREKKARVEERERAWELEKKERLLEEERDWAKERERRRLVEDERVKEIRRVAEIDREREREREEERKIENERRQQIEEDNERDRKDTLKKKKEADKRRDFEEERERRRKIEMEEERQRAYEATREDEQERKRKEEKLIGDDRERERERRWRTAEERRREMEEKRELEEIIRTERQVEMEREAERSHYLELKKSFIERGGSQHKREDTTSAEVKGIETKRNSSIHSVRLSTDNILPVHVYTLAELHASYSDLHSALDPGPSFPDFFQSSTAGLTSTSSATTSSASASGNQSYSSKPRRPVVFSPLPDLNITIGEKAFSPDSGSFSSLHHDTNNSIYMSRLTENTVSTERTVNLTANIGPSGSVSTRHHHSVHDLSELTIRDRERDRERERGREENASQGNSKNSVAERSRERSRERSNIWRGSVGDSDEEENWGEKGLKVLSPAVGFSRLNMIPQESGGGSERERGSESESRRGSELERGSERESRRGSEREIRRESERESWREKIADEQADRNVFEVDGSVVPDVKNDRISRSSSRDSNRKGWSDRIVGDVSTGRYGTDNIRSYTVTHGAATGDPELSDSTGISVLSSNNRKNNNDKRNSNDNNNNNSNNDNNSSNNNNNKNSKSNYVDQTSIDKNKIQNSSPLTGAYLHF